MCFAFGRHSARVIVPSAISESVDAEDITVLNTSGSVLERDPLRGGVSDDRDIVSVVEGLDAPIVHPQHLESSNQAHS
jgi:hypothetical protein